MGAVVMEKHQSNGASKKSFDATDLIERYTSVRHYSEYICEPLLIEDYVVQPHDDVSPPKWHLAHTTWFFEEFILNRFYKNYTKFHPDYAYIFNSYYNSVGSRVEKTHRGNLSRPTVDDVFEYRAYVDEHMRWLLQDFPDEAFSVLELGLNHEQQHQELLYTDIKYILGNNPLFPSYKKETLETPHVEHHHDFISVSEGRYMIGYHGDGFSYDNEHGEHHVWLRPFSIRESLVTNAEYLHFIHAGGYQRHEFWLSDGWNWVKENKIKHPLYWHNREGHWCRYALSGLEHLNAEEPVTHVSYYEASAFAAWKGMRLPTEFEWEAAANQLHWGLRWEYTNSAYLPYPGYAKPAGAVGEYNGKFMINNMVLRGASVFTSENHSRKTYRNFFYPQQRWQFTGIRLCK
jgi:ergothioneine biosynthesis protein EgtB